MTTYIITYDLLAPNKKYAEMIKRLRRMEPKQRIESLLKDLSALPDCTYILNTSLSAEAILAELRAPGGIDDDDRILIAGLTGEFVKHPAN